MKRYRNKYEHISNNDSEEEKAFFSEKNPSYQVTKEYQHKQFPTGYEKSRHISQKMEYGDPNGKNGKISSKSEKFYTFYTESSSPRVNFNSKNSAKNYMDKRAFTPSRFGHNNMNIEEKSNYNMEDNEYISELREEYSNPIINNRVNIRKKVYRGNQTPQPYRTNEYQEYKNNEEEEFLDNYGYHETKNIKDKSHKKYDSITHITGYSNLIPLNRLKQCGRIESINYSSRKEQENKPSFKNAIEKVRELQRGKREYDEFMKKLGRDNDNEEKIENYKREQLRQQEIREEQIRLERLREERIREEQMRNEKMRQERIRIEKMRQNEQMMRDKMNNDKKRQEELRLIKIREEKIRQERIRQEQIKKDKIKQQEKINQDRIRQEKIRQERLKQEEKAKNKSKPKAETYKKIVINTEVVSTARSDSVKKQFKAHSGRYKYKENITEDINKYRNNSNLKEPNNIAKKETVYKNKKINKETNKSYSKLPIKININTTTKSYSRNQSSKNLKTTTDYSVKNKTNIDKNKTQNYRIKTNKTTITTTSNNIVGEGRKNSYRSNNTSINTDKNKNIKNYTSNYTKKSYTSYSNFNNKNTYPDRTNNNYKRSMIKVAEKTASLNYPNPHIKVDTYGSKYTGEQYHRDYINIENKKYGKIANHIHTGISKDGQYLISMTSAQKIPDENVIYEPPEKEVEEIVSTVREKKKNLGDNYAFYESKHLQKPDNSSYTIHKRFGERTIYGKEKYETKKVRHYKIKSGEEGKYLDYNDGGYTDDNNYEYNTNNKMNEYNKCECGNIQRVNTGDDYENVNFDYSPDSPEGPIGQEEEYENRVEEYNYESY